MNKEEALEFIAQSVKSDVDMAKVADAIKAIEQDPNIRNCFGCKYSKDNHNQAIEECHLCMWQNQYTPITKNNLPHCQHTDEEIAKSFIEDVEAVKDQLPCGEQMDFPNTFDEFAKDYGFRDKDEIYTNGSELIPIFRVKQWLEHISTTKNDLGVDCVSRKEVEKLVYRFLREGIDENIAFYEHLLDLPSVTPQEQQTFKWCTDCKEYDQEKHCCHRWSKVIRNTVEEMKQEQEPILDKIRAEIETIIGERNLDDYDFCSGLICARKIIDKYKAEQE